MDETLVQLVKAIQDIAPQVWAIYSKQVLVDLVQFGILIILLTSSMVVLVNPVRRVWDDLEEFKFLGVFLVLFAVGLDALLIREFVGRIINPDYYAIQKLLGVIDGRW